MNHLSVKPLSRLPAPARRFLYFGLQTLIGSRILATWKEFLSWERLDPSQLNRAVEDRLGTLLAAASSQSEHYRKLHLQRGPGESAAEYLRRFPLLSRSQVREHFQEIVIDPLRSQITSPSSVASKRYDWLVVKTGGTTGVPTTVVHDARARDWGRATRLYAARLCGLPLGTRYFRLWGSEPDLLQTQAKLQLRVLSNLLGEIPLNAFRAKEAELRRHAQTMLDHPEVKNLVAYVDAAASLAFFIREHKLPRPHLKTIMACAGTVLPEFREALQDVFQAQVYDKYGSRDCCDMACECSQHSGLHVFSPNIFMEIVDEQGNPCQPGQVGRILISLLNNPSFPLIRYEVGDVGAWAEPGPCACGSPFQRIRGLQGRQDDMLVTEDGTLQSSVFVRHFVGVSLNRQLISEWQLEQTARTRFVFRYIPLKREGLQENLRKIKDSFLLVFGNTAEIELKQVSEIPPSATGKIRWIINSYRNCSKS